MATTEHRYVPPHLRVLNFLIRVLGVGSLLVGVVALVSFAVAPGHPLAYLIVGLFCLCVGIAFLRVKKLTPDDLARFTGDRR